MNTNMNVTEPIAYELKRQKGRRGIRLSVHPGGRVVVCAPHSYPRLLIDRMVRGRTSWLREKIAELSGRPIPLLARRDPEEYRARKEEARAFITARVALYAPQVGVRPERIAIRDQRTRYGSCARTGTLSFSYKLLLLPLPLADYVVVHELCHLIAFDHSARFWREVERFVPDFRELRRALQAC